MTWMSERLRRDVQRVVKNNCASFSGSDGCILGGTCAYFRELLPEQESHRCVWAESGVLPNDPDVESLYMDKLADYLCIKDETHYGKCQRCGRGFTKRSNRSVYCDDCRDVVAKEKNRQRVKAHKQAKKAVKS